MTLQNIFSNKMEISLNIAGILLITNRLKMASNRRFVMAFCKNRMKPFFSRNNHDLYHTASSAYRPHKEEVEGSLSTVPL